MLSFKPTFSLSTFTFIKRLLSSPSLSAIRVVSSEVIDISPGNLDSSLCFFQPSVSHELRQIPSDPVQPIHQRIASRPVGLNRLSHASLRAVQRDDRRDLDRLEHPIIQVALEPRQGRNNPRIADAEPNPPARHIVALGERKELYPDLFCPRDLQETRRLIAVKGQVRVGKVVDQKQVVLLRERHDLFEKSKVYSGGSRVVGKAQDQELGRRPTFPVGGHKRLVEIGSLFKADAADVPPRDDY